MPTQIKLQRPGKGAPPPAEATSVNLTKPPSGGKVHQQVKIDPEIRREFRAEAAINDMELGEMFERVWQVYKTNR